MSDADNEGHDGPLTPYDLDQWPGRFEGKWVGRQRWRTQHGPALVCWDANRIERVDNARLDDGSRKTIDGPRVGSLTSRTPNPDGQGFIHGILVVYREDVEFVPLVRNYRPEVRTEVLPAFRALRDMKEFMAFLNADFLNAYAAYSALQNRKVTLPDGAMLQFGQRSAAGMIAALRDNGEDYLDYFANDEPYDAAWPLIETARKLVEQNGLMIGEQ